MPDAFKEAVIRDASIDAILADVETWTEEKRVQFYLHAAEAIDCLCHVTNTNVMADDMRIEALRHAVAMFDMVQDGPIRYTDPDAWKQVCQWLGLSVTIDKQGEKYELLRDPIAGEGAVTAEQIIAVMADPGFRVSAPIQATQRAIVDKLEGLGALPDRFNVQALYPIHIAYIDVAKMILEQRTPTPQTQAAFEELRGLTGELGHLTREDDTIDLKTKRKLQRLYALLISLQEHFSFELQ